MLSVYVYTYCQDKIHVYAHTTERPRIHFFKTTNPIQNSKIIEYSNILKEIQYKLRRKYFNSSFCVTNQSSYWEALALYDFVWALRGIRDILKIFFFQPNEA
jgi:hypothetical protein